MNEAALLPALVTALMAGLLGAGHCFGMCGGIAGGLGAFSTGNKAHISAWLFNIGRICSYALVGGIAGLGLGLGGEFLGIASWGRYLRFATAILILLVGLRYLLNLSALAVIEKAGAGVWARISPLAQKAARQPGPGGRFLLGLCWGLLPCGLVYTMLLTAASTGNFRQGALVMLAFGIGTLPALLGMTLWAPALAGLLQDRAFRRLAGLGLVLLSAWALFLLLASRAGHSH